jgi:hypothetical protein
MQIVIAKNIQTQLFDIFIANQFGELKIDSLGFSNLSETEAKTRADSLKSALCCPIVRGDCDDYLLFKEIEIG